MRIKSDTGLTTFWFVLVLSLLVVLVFIAHTPWHGTTTPHGACPTEDSCAISYHDGAWHITPDTP